MEDNLSRIRRLQAGGPMTFNRLPTKNRISVINNYSPTYDYIVEDDKIYKSIKGRNQWIEISDNEVARKNLLNFIHDKYDFRGYEDNERKIYDMMKNEGITNYDTIRARLKPARSTQPAAARPAARLQIPRIDTSKVELPRHIEQASTLRVDSPWGKPLPNGDVTAPWNTTVVPSWQSRINNWVDEHIDLGINWFKRQMNKLKDEPSLETMKYTDTYDAPNSQYYTQRPSQTGDTLTINNDKIPGRYYMQESYNLNDVRLGARNRGDLHELNTEGAIVTALNPFLPYNRVTRKSGTYIGIDKNGRLKAGNYADFEDGDLMSASFSNNVKEFVRNPDGSLKIISDAQHGNRSHYIPVVRTISDDGTSEREGIPVNLITRSGDKDTSKFGKIAGGRVIMRAGNDFRLVSGSIDDIAAAFDDMKRRNNVPYVTFYTMDNGTFNVALRTKNKKLTSDNLREYDLSNASGGNFLYILPNQNAFRSDTTFTKNVRTDQDESYRKGHPLTNQLRGIVNHHTGIYPGGIQEVLQDFENSHGTDNARSAHVVIDQQGNRHVLARPEQVTFHGGFSRWAGQNNVNDFMLGVEFLGDTNQQDLTPEQIQSYVEYVKPIIRQYQIPFENIATHQQVRDEYNKWARENGEREAASKPDINMANQSRILDELLRQVYIKK